jgi:hypothetical protein
MHVTCHASGRSHPQNTPINLLNKIRNRFSREGISPYSYNQNKTTSASQLMDTNIPYDREVRIIGEASVAAEREPPLQHSYRAVPNMTIGAQ